MCRFIVLVLIALTSQIGHAQGATVETDGSQKLMLILLDGFRWDYVEKYNLENFKRFYTQGVRAHSMQNVFPTLSFPNYYSIVTGLHPESHEMVGNLMYDKETGESFIMNYDPVTYLKPHWWEGAWPIWVSVEEQGKSAHMFHWFGPEVPIHGIHPTLYVPYTGNPTPVQFRGALKQGLAALTNGSADFVGVYNEEPDYAGHVYGPDSQDLGVLLMGIDEIIGELLDEMEDLGAEDKVNLMVVSDHGMTGIDRSRVINLTSILTPDLYTSITEDNSMTNIFLSDPSLEDDVYNLLVNFHPNMTVYKRKDVPEKYHWKHGKHVPLIVCVADLGWAIVHPLYTDFFKNKKTGLDMKGMHGYVNTWQDMKGIFYGMGPYFKEGSSVKSILVVDLYNVMCGILGITPKPNNGTLQHMSPLLASAPGSAPTFYVQTMFVQILTLAIFVIFSFS